MQGACTAAALSRGKSGTAGVFKARKLPEAGNASAVRAMALGEGLAWWEVASLGPPSEIRQSKAAVSSAGSAPSAYSWRQGRPARARPCKGLEEAALLATASDWPLKEEDLLRSLPAILNPPEAG